MTDNEREMEDQIVDLNFEIGHLKTQVYETQRKLFFAEMTISALVRKIEPNLTESGFIIPFPRGLTGRIYRYSPPANFAAVEVWENDPNELAFIIGFYPEG